MDVATLPSSGKWMPPQTEHSGKQLFLNILLLLFTEHEMHKWEDNY